MTEGFFYDPDVTQQQDAAEHVFGQTAQSWFDQFTEEDLSQIHGNGQWCARHWAPCPVLGANGLGAQVELMQIFMSEFISAKTADGINQEMHNMGNLCCTLGDERMYEIWGHWPPTGAQMTIVKSDD